MRLPKLLRYELNQAMAEISPRQMWRVRAGFYLVFAIFFTWLCWQGELFLGEFGLYGIELPDTWPTLALVGLISSLSGIALHLMGWPNLCFLLVSLALYAYSGTIMEPYYTQANYFFASLVIVTLPVMVWEKRVKPGENIFGSLPCFLFLAVFYIRVAYVKSHPGWLPGGDAMASLAGTPLIVTPLGREFFSLGWALQSIVAPGVVGAEFLLGIGIFGAIFSRRLRWVVAVGMIVFHFTLGLFMDIGYFPIFSLLAAAAIFPVPPLSLQAGFGSFASLFCRPTFARSMFSVPPA